MKKDLVITERMKLEAQVFEQLRKDVLSTTEMALEEQEKQSNLIGQELHDNINQILAAALLQLSMIKTNPNETRELVDLAMNNLHQAINETRKLSHVLVAPDFKTHSLVDQIVSLTSTMLKASGIKVYIHATGIEEKLMEDKQKLTIYRVAQEQCNNIIKHAKARVVNIFLSTTSVAFKMIISDDGNGMEASKHAEGIGLRNIKARLSIFNGVVNIVTPPYKGFTLEITIPLK